MSNLLLSAARLLPSTIKQRIKTSPLFVRHRSRWTNIYHCTVYRTGSQWIRRIMSDREVLRYSGLQYEMYFQRILSTPEQSDQTIPNKTFPYSKAFTKGFIIGLYASYPSYMQVPLAEKQRVFFVLRDPRDIIISHYYTWLRDAGNLNNPHYAQLAKPATGISLTIKHLNEMGLFGAMRSWVSIPENETQILLMHFEDLTGLQQFEEFQKLFAYCDIAMPDQVLKKLLSKYSFEAMSGGRQRGEENPHSHYRKGIVNDWQTHFSEKHIAEFQAITGNLVSLCGYSW